MTRSLQSAIADLSTERGVTLIELLVVLSAGLVVFTALFALLDVTIHQTSRATSQVNATQEGRTALGKIEHELSSSCVGGSLSPIQSDSSDTQLSFVSGYGSQATVTPVKHVVTFTPGGGTHGTLTDSTYTASGSSSSPTWTLSSTDTLLGDVDQVPGTPMFQYFDYQDPMSGTTPYLDPAGNQYVMLLDGTGTLPSGATLGGSPVPSGTIPANSPSPASSPSLAAEALINFVAYPNGGNDVDPNLSSSADTLTDTVVLRLTPVANHGGGSPNTSPCA